MWVILSFKFETRGSDLQTAPYLSVGPAVPAAVNASVFVLTAWPVPFHFRAHGCLLGCKLQIGAHNRAQGRRTLKDESQMPQDANKLTRRAELLASLERLRRELEILDGLDCSLAAVYVATACEALESDIKDEPIA